MMELRVLEPEAFVGSGEGWREGGFDGAGVMGNRRMGDEARLLAGDSRSKRRAGAGDQEREGPSILAPATAGCSTGVGWVTTMASTLPVGKGNGPGAAQRSGIEGTGGGVEARDATGEGSVEEPSWITSLASPFRPCDENAVGLLSVTLLLNACPANFARSVANTAGPATLAERMSGGGMTISPLGPDRVTPPSSTVAPKSTMLGTPLDEGIPADHIGLKAGVSGKV
jgi:hypothetical protein